MNIVWCVAAVLIGLGLGLSFGMLLRAVIANWESALTASKIYMTVMLALFGGGTFGATALFAKLLAADNAAFYLLGLGAGLVLSVTGCFSPARPYTLKGIRDVIKMGDALRGEIPDVDDRAAMIAAQFMPPKAIEREARISEQELASRLERAADAISVDGGERVSQ